eukprot:364138-Alexandrium_andersonii.AAC.1
MAHNSKAPNRADCLHATARPLVSGWWHEGFGQFDVHPRHPSASNPARPPMFCDRAFSQPPLWT